MKIKRITTKLLATIIPVIIVALAVVTLISVSTSRTNLDKEINEKMEAKVEAIDSDMSNALSKIEYATQGLGRSIGSSMMLLSSDITAYRTLCVQYMAENDSICGLGIFLDPEYYTMFPLINYYISREDDGYVSYDYSLMDLTAQSWYVAAKATGGAQYTDTYIDNQAKILMTSYVVPMYDAFGRFIGCFNTDIDMSKIQADIAEIKVGRTGSATLISCAEEVLNEKGEDTSTRGMYITGDEDKVLSAEHKITNQNDEYYAVSDAILNEVSTVQKAGGKLVYTKKIPGYNWVLMLTIDQSEIEKPVDDMTASSLAVLVIAMIICVVIIWLVSRSIARPIKNVKSMSELMAKGDFSMQPMPVKTVDEIGNMTQALNQMLVANRNEMLEIASNSETVGRNCEDLKSAVTDLEESFQVINKSIRGINEAMMDNSATTEELSASVQEVKDAVGNLADRAKDSDAMATEIMGRATKIGHETNESFERAMKLTSQYEDRLGQSIQNAKVVEDIQQMAAAINDIADQINLLSLNASIEAARAGEAGRGFAVVAGEIGSLANQTSSTVNEIQETIDKVRGAVDTLAGDSHAVIEFINKDITPDYQSFVKTAKQYEADAQSIQELAAFVSDTAGNLNETMETVNIAIQNIAEASQNATGESSVIIESVDTVSDHVINVGKISEEQRNVADGLANVVHRYKLK